MNKMMIFISLSVYLILVTVSGAQVPDVIESGINSSLISKYGNVSIISRIIDVNLEKNEYQYDILPITDPYGALADCYLFTATVNERGILGVYKSNNLVWDSGPMAYGGYDHRIFGTADLNNDGTVEILAVWDYGMHNPIQNLWIISWNGQNGTIINKKSHFWLPEDQESEIYTFDYLTEIVDVEGDGIWEIKGINVEKRDEPKIYSWNGQLYGDYGVVMPDYLPMNLLSAEVSCTVSESQYGLLYEYSVKNESNSKQAIFRFAIDKPYVYVRAGTEDPNEKWTHYYSTNEDLLIWEMLVNNQNYPNDYIDPGFEKTGFKLETDAEIITIGNFYIQGKNGGKDNDQDIYTNSYSSQALCGKDPSVPFIPVEFLDELTNYIDQSFDLGWIKDDKTFNKLMESLEDAKDQLSNGNSRETLKKLNDFIKDVEKEENKKLSSEAYALLYYNAEYLTSQLPAVELKLESMSPTITIEKTKDFTLTVYGSDFSRKSDIYFSGKKQKTKFISENELEAEIKDKDIKKEGTYKVHVSEKKIGRTEELEFNVYKELPERLIPVINCVEDLEGKKSLAWFGYENYNDGTVFIEGKKENEIKGGKKPKGKDKKDEEVPPVLFLPGVHEKVFSVEFDDKKKLKWELLKEKAEVTEETPVCE